ncbi:STM3941 family protein [Pontibacter sp. BT731]|uniref:STM3941 family protein n=1 Tax=Pontibacter coccineus TaxID=3063328 RepID=UPI0026E1D057|nr:STM3941 family protein [Pontibacter sp. BT731]MDO6390434.1 STM3941 family protein [Pontibacter sp. BT731]
MENKTEIPLNKSKIAIHLAVVLVFWVFGLVSTFEPSTFVTDRFPHETPIRLIGIVNLLFCSIGVTVFTKQIFSKKSGLTIDKDGVIDNLSKVGLIEWKDIKGFKTSGVSSTRLLIVFTSKPKKYLDRAGSKTSKRTMKSNWRIHGSPLVIVSGSLKIKSDELERLIKTEFEKNKAPHNKV